MLKKIIYFFLLIIIFNFSAQSFDHNFKWNNQEHINENITTKIFCLDPDKIAYHFSNNEKITKAINELKGWNIYPYLLEINNQTENQYELNINDWIFKQNFFRSLKGNPFEKVTLFPNPIISSLFFLTALITIEYGFFQQPPFKEATQLEQISTFVITTLAQGYLFARLQYKIHRNHKLRNTLIEYGEKQDKIEENTTIKILIGVHKKHKNIFEKAISQYKINITDVEFQQKDWFDKPKTLTKKVLTITL